MLKYLTMALICRESKVYIEARDLVGLKRLEKLSVLALCFLLQLSLYCWLLVKNPSESC